LGEGEIFTKGFSVEFGTLSASDAVDEIFFTFKHKGFATREVQPSISKDTSVTAFLGHDRYL